MNRIFANSHHKMYSAIALRKIKETLPSVDMKKSRQQCRPKPKNSR